MSSFLYLRAIVCMCTRVCVVSFILCSIHACLLVSLSLSLSLSFYVYVCRTRSLPLSICMYVCFSLPVCPSVFICICLAGWRRGRRRCPHLYYSRCPPLGRYCPPRRPPSLPPTLTRHSCCVGGTITYPPVHIFNSNCPPRARGGCRSCVRALIGVVILRNGDSISGR